jgi:3-methyladenine DNA glycosylase/8-oxoguanine DNA glycosylase
MKITIPAPAGFNFRRTVHSHGWATLEPFSIDRADRSLCCILGLSNGNVVSIIIREKSDGSLMVVSDRSVKSKERKYIINQVRSCFRLDEDFTEFYREAGKCRKFRWIARSGVGRLLRAPTVFEDVIKMICTTNCSWSLTEVMVNNLCRKLGKKAGDDQYAFPTPSAISSRTEKFIRKEIRAGYRAPYILELSRDISDGKRDIEKWRALDLPTADLYKEICSVKGVGPYAAANILKLVGKYDYLGIDSWCRKQFAEMYKNGRSVNDKVIEKFYEPFGKWKGLFFWLDLTKHWQDKKDPF